MTTKNQIILGVVVAVIAFTSAMMGGLVAKGGSLLGGGSYEAIPKQFGNGLSAGLSNQLTIDSSGAITSDATVSGGTVNVTTTNAATSTIIAGCVQGYATSTVTPVHLEFSTTTSLATYSGGAAPTAGLGGGVSWRYGACPNL
jgi:hypothetical protein